MLISQLTESPIKVRPFEGWGGGQVGGVVVEADNEDEVENELEEVEVEEIEVEVEVKFEEIEVKFEEIEVEAEDKIKVEVKQN